MPLGIYFDIARPRVTRRSLRTGVDGQSWDTDTFDGCFCDPVTNSVFLQPQVLDPDWYTSVSGPYARLAMADFRKASGLSFVALPSDEWAQPSVRLNGDYYLQNKGVNYPVFTAAEFSQNRPFFLSFYVPDGKALSATAIECGWGIPGESDTVSLRVYGGGDIEVWKGATLVGRYDAVRQQDFRQGKPGSAAPSGARAGLVIDLFLIPCRRRELLVFGSDGSGFSHTFADLDPDTVNFITQPGRFWWSVAAGHASVQCVPMIFPVSGDAYRKPHALRTPPPTGSVFDAIPAWDEPGYGTGAALFASLVETDGSPYVPDGVENEVRIKAILTGDGTNTPFLYALDFLLPPGVEETDDSEETEVSDYVRRASINVGESPDSVRFDMLVGADVPIAAPEEQSNRPIGILLQTGGGTPRHLLVGATEAPDTEARQKEVGGTPDLIQITARDLWKQLEMARYVEDGPPLDGLLLTDWVAWFLREAGIPDSEHEIEASTFPIPYTPAVSRGEWNFQVKAGDTVAKWLITLRETFAPTWDMGFYPTLTGPKFRFCSEDNLGMTPAAEAYRDREGITSRFAVRKWKQKVLPPEASRVSVYGYDPAIRTFYLDSYTNAAIEDPAPAPSARPEGWLGEIWPFVLVDERLTNAYAVTAAKNQFVERIGSPLRVAEWQSPLLVRSNGLPLWRGDVVRIHPTGDYRILSFSGDLSSEGTGWRNISYVGKYIGPIPEEEP